ncbi:MAG TPA: epoxide hydrolase, partial [Jiangellaceae bacterium]|nr:epoxide hydrolase [Jiangellaceae bacterium]
MVVPYEISVAEDVLIDTRERIRATRWAEPVAGDEWRYGASIPYLKDLLDYWAESYDWRTWEAKLNSQPHFMTTVDGLDLHFWHVRGKKENSIPLLLLHGWPGSVIEYFDLLGPLTDPAAHGQPDQPSFDVVLAELPGFGFGGKPAEEGWGPTRMANALDALMREKLGYEHYGIHGGDWGTLLGAKIARLHAGPVAALQVSMPMSQPHSGHTPSP